MAVLSFENMSGDPEQEYFVSAVGYLMGVRPWAKSWCLDIDRGVALNANRTSGGLRRHTRAGIVTDAIIAVPTSLIRS